MKIGTIFYPTDFSPSAENALNYAIYVARKFKASLLLFHSDEYSSLLDSPSVHAYSGYSALSEAIERVSRDSLKDLVSRIPPDIKTRSIYTVGRAYHQILMTSFDEKSDLIVMGTQGRSNLSNYFMGSNAERVVRHSTCPVLTVRKGQSSPEFKKIVFGVDFSLSNIDLIGKAVDLASHFGAHLLLANIETMEDEFSDSDDAFRQILSETDFKGVAHSTKVNRNANVYDGLNDLAKEEKADLLVIGTHGQNIKRFVIGSRASGIVNNTMIPVLTFPHES